MGSEVHFTATGQGEAFSVLVYDSLAAANWIDKHYDDVALTDLRTKGCCGPMAILLSPQEPAIGMFGNVTNNIIAHLQALADIANFPVVLLPLSHDPTSCMMYVFHEY